MHRHYWIGLVGVCVLSGCAHEREGAAAAPDLAALGERIARTICPGPATRVEPVPNRHTPGQLDRLETRDCATGSATLYLGGTTSNPAGLAVAASVKVPLVDLPTPVQIGQPIRGAIRVLGRPRSADAGAVTYSLDMESQDTFTLYVANGRITSVQWAWWVD